MRHLDREEWNQWGEICLLLQETSAITKDDLNTTVGSRNTNGQRLLDELRKWGNLRFEQGKVSDELG